MGQPTPSSPDDDLPQVWASILPGVKPEEVQLAAELECLRRGELELILEYPFGTQASGLQKAICRAADGLPVGDALSDEEIIKYFGCLELMQHPTCVPTLVVLVAGIRSGKSLLASMAQVARVMTCDMSKIKRHLNPRVRIICPKAENAKQTFDHILAAIAESPGLRAMVVGEPKFSPHPSIIIKRFDGRLVQISIAAADSGGLSMRSGWLAGFVLDEAAMFGESATGAVVNAEEILEAAETRLLPGGQGWIVSSPYGPVGLLYNLYTLHWGKPGRVLVVRAPTLAMNPSFSKADVEAIRLEKPDVAAREYDAEWVDADAAFFEGLLIDKSLREDVQDVPPQEGSRYLAAMDAGMRGNAWTLVIARDTRDRYDRIAKIEVAFAYEWIGSRQNPLDPAVVFAEMKEKLTPYGITTVNCDAYALDPLRSVAKSVQVRLNEHTFKGEQKTEVYRSVDTLLRQARLSLPNIAALIRDLKAIRRRATAGQVLPHLPHTSDGRHCDFGPAVSLAVWLLSGQNFSRDMEAAMKVVNEAGGAEAWLNGES